MSDIFVSAGVDVDGGEVTRSLTWTPHTHTWSGSQTGLFWAVGRVDDPALWEPAYDPASGVRVLLGGRAAFEPWEWDAAERLPYEGGLACRLILSRWLERGAAGVETLNGAALTVIIDRRSREVHVWTDRLGFFPSFLWTRDSFLLCSHPDVAAEALARAGRACAFDDVTMAEFLRTGMAVHPYTYWQGIIGLDSGTHYRFTFGGEPRLVERSQYWRPAYFDTAPIADRREVVARLSDALRAAVRRRTHARLGRVALMLSAGADSRAALFTACDPSRVTSYTFYDEPNPELKGARHLSDAAGAKHVSVQRDPEYYIEHAPEAVRLSGGMWSIDSAHYGGVTNRVCDDNAGVVLTGCYADYLLKGLAFNRRHRMLFGRTIPLYQLDSYAHEFYLPFCRIAPQWHTRVEERLNARYGCPADSHASDPRQAEYLRLTPLSREGDASGRLFLWRTLPIDPWIGDQDVLDVYGRISVADKVSGIAFGKAVARLVGPAGRAVANNNYGAPVGAGEVARVGFFCLSSLRRKLDPNKRHPFERNSRSIATLGSWPHFPRVIERSERLRSWRAEMPRDQETFLFDILGEERRTWSVEDWGRRDPVLFLRLFTASLWLTQTAGLGADKVCANPANEH